MEELSALETRLTFICPDKLLLEEHLSTNTLDFASFVYHKKITQCDAEHIFETVISARVFMQVRYFL